MRLIFRCDNLLPRLLIAATLLTAMTIPSTTYSAEQVDIYTINVPVKSQSPYFRNLAMREGLSEVLIRASGSEDVLSNEYIRTSLVKANAFVQQFAFQKAPNSIANAKKTPWILHLHSWTARS